jgi:hypothetical protein
MLNTEFSWCFGHRVSDEFPGIAPGGLSLDASDEVSRVSKMWLNGDFTFGIVLICPAERPR